MQYFDAEKVAGLQTKMMEHLGLWQVAHEEQAAESFKAIRSAGAVAKTKLSGVLSKAAAKVNIFKYIALTPLSHIGLWASAIGSGISTSQFINDFSKDDNLGGALMVGKTALNSAEALAIIGQGAAKAIERRVGRAAVELAGSGAFSGLTELELTALASEEVMAETALVLLRLASIGSVLGSLPVALSLIALGFAIDGLYSWLKDDEITTWVKHLPFAKQLKMKAGNNDFDYLVSLKHLLYQPKATWSSQPDSQGPAKLQVNFPQFNSEESKLELDITMTLYNQVQGRGHGGTRLQSLADHSSAWRENEFLLTVKLKYRIYVNNDIVMPAFDEQQDSWYHASELSIKV